MKVDARTNNRLVDASPQGMILASDPCPMYPINIPRGSPPIHSPQAHLRLNSGCWLLPRQQYQFAWAWNGAGKHPLSITMNRQTSLKQLSPEDMSSGEVVNLPRAGNFRLFGEPTTKTKSNVGIFRAGPAAVCCPLAILGIVPRTAAQNAVFTGYPDRQDCWKANSRNKPHQPSHSPTPIHFRPYPKPHMGWNPWENFQPERKVENRR